MGASVEALRRTGRGADRIAEALHRGLTVTVTAVISIAVNLGCCSVMERRERAVVISFVGVGKVEGKVGIKGTQEWCKASARRGNRQVAKECLELLIKAMCKSKATVGRPVPLTLPSSCRSLAASGAAGSLV